MNIQFNIIILFAATLLTGFYAGTGFFVIVGGNPAILKMSNATFAEYWQHTDLYMAARMKIFGPILLLTLLTVASLHIYAWRTPVFWLLLSGLLILVTDVIFTFSTNHPYNQLIQNWDLNKLPENVQEIKHKVVNAFWIRSGFMIASFTCVLLALFFKMNGNAIK